MSTLIVTVSHIDVLDLGHCHFCLSCSSFLQLVGWHENICQTSFFCFVSYQQKNDDDGSTKDSRDTSKDDSKSQTGSDDGSNVIMNSKLCPRSPA